MNKIQLPREEDASIVKNGNQIAILAISDLHPFHVMPYLMVRTKVKDFAAWKALFDQHSESRRQNGSKGGYFFQNADNPNETIFLLEWDNLDKARRFAGDHSVRNVLAQAGLTDRPDVYFLEAISKLHC